MTDKGTLVKIKKLVDASLSKSHSYEDLVCCLKLIKKEAEVDEGKLAERLDMIEFDQLTQAVGRRGVGCVIGLLVPTSEEPETQGLVFAQYGGLYQATTIADILHSTLRKYCMPGKIKPVRKGT